MNGLRDRVFVHAFPATQGPVNLQTGERLGSGLRSCEAGAARFHIPGPGPPPATLGLTLQGHKPSISHHFKLSFAWQISDKVNGRR